jgi:acetoin:2,6-dichlorophenolindophenol oxidoreductase subunit alpha
LDKKLITQEIIEEMLKNSEKSLSISKDTIITPLAMDMISKNGVTINYSDKNYENKITSDAVGIKNPQIDLAATAKVPYDFEKFPVELILKFYTLMLKIRLFEEVVKVLKEKEIIPGVFVHLYLGQEAIAVGVCSALTDMDFITSTHRGHGHLIAKGADTKQMLAEMLGKADGYCRGKGGSMHITDIGIGILGANGIVGAGLPIACGSGLASKLTGDNAVTVAFFGDGASNQGTFGESLNFAKIFCLPVLFLCENNGYAVSTPTSYGCSTPDIYKRGLGYGIDSQLVNGDDVFEVYKVCQKHIEQMRKNPHPVLIEARTHRRIGHWVGDTQNYRSVDEMQELPKYDPIKIFLANIKSRADITNQVLEKIAAEVQDELRNAVIFANNSPYPAVEEAIKYYLKEKITI